jgi:hypothetical protein
LSVRKRLLLLSALVVVITGCQTPDILTSEYALFRDICEREEIGRTIHREVSADGYLSPSSIYAESCAHDLLFPDRHPPYKYCEDDHRISYIAYKGHPQCSRPFRFVYELNDSFNNNFCVVTHEKQKRLSRYTRLQTRESLSSSSNPGIFSNTYRSVSKHVTEYWDLLEDQKIATFVDYQYSSSFLWGTEFHKCSERLEGARYMPLHYPQDVIKPPSNPLKIIMVSWDCINTACQLDLEISNSDPNVVDALIKTYYKDEQSPPIRTSTIQFFKVSDKETTDLKVKLDLKRKPFIDFDQKYLTLRAVPIYIEPSASDLSYVR